MTEAHDLLAKGSWQFACDWYDEDGVARSIARSFDPLVKDAPEIPSDVQSPEFAKWLTDQYRLAMCKGIDICRQACVLLDSPNRQTPEHALSEP